MFGSIASTMSLPLMLFRGHESGPVHPSASRNGPSRAQPCVGLTESVVPGCEYEAVEPSVRRHDSEPGSALPSGIDRPHAGHSSKVNTMPRRSDIMRCDLNAFRFGSLCSGICLHLHGSRSTRSGSVGKHNLSSRDDTCFWERLSRSPPRVRDPHRAQADQPGSWPPSLGPVLKKCYASHNVLVPHYGKLTAQPWSCRAIGERPRGLRQRPGPLRSPATAGPLRVSAMRAANAATSSLTACKW
jgi:hypothetical protein